MPEKKLVIMLLNANPDIPSNLGTPFFQATAAAAMDMEVEIFFAGRTTHLLKRGFAENLYPSKAKIKSVYAFMQDAHRAGVKFFACGGAMGEHELNDETAIPELDAIHGGASFINAITDDDVITLTY